MRRCGARADACFFIRTELQAEGHWSGLRCCGEIQTPGGGGGYFGGKRVAVVIGAGYLAGDCLGRIGGF